jgi:hypothetical protein
MTLNTTPSAQDSDSYQSLEEFKAEADNRGFDYSSYADQKLEQSARRVTSWIDNTYRSRFPGCATDVWQALEWPRVGVIYRGHPLDDDVIPAQIKSAQYEGMTRDLAQPGVLSPDLERGGAIKELQAGSVDIVYADGAPVETIFKTIDLALSGLVLPAKGSTSVSFVARA